MRVTLENTTKLVEIVINGATVPARVWEGVTANGIPCHAFITRIAVGKDEDAAEFERDLAEKRPPTEALEAAIPARFVL
jgi:hypothetical protein